MTMDEPAPVSALRQLTDQAHERHFDDAAGAGRHLAAGVALLPGEAADAEHYLRTAQHVLLGHLDDALALSRVLDAVPASCAEAAVARARLAIRLAEDLRALAGAALPPAAQLNALYDAALARTRRGDWPGVQACMEAAGSLADRHGEDLAAQRAHAAMQNNIAGDLRYDLKPAHRADTARVQTMLDAARRAREAWGRAGGWVEAERAEYQLALCHAAAGLGGQAVEHARACVAICEAHGADAYERLFAHEALARAHASAGQGAAAQAQSDRVAALVEAVEDPASREFAQEALRQLETDLASLQ
jgi:hypothetical protein